MYTRINQAKLFHSLRGWGLKLVLCLKHNHTKVNNLLWVYSVK